MAADSDDSPAAARAAGAEASPTAAAPAAAAPARTRTWNHTMWLQKKGVGANDILGAARVVGLGWMSPDRLWAISGEWLFCGRRGPHTGEVVLDLSTGHWRRIDDVHGHHGIFDIANVHSSVGDFGAVDGDSCLVAGLLAEDEGRALQRACIRIQRQWRLTGRDRCRGLPTMLSRIGSVPTRCPRRTCPTSPLGQQSASASSGHGQGHQFAMFKRDSASSTTMPRLAGESFYSTGRGEDLSGM